MLWIDKNNCFFNQLQVIYEYVCLLIFQSWLIYKDFATYRYPCWCSSNPQRLTLSWMILMNPVHLLQLACILVAQSTWSFKGNLGLSFEERRDRVVLLSKRLVRQYLLVSMMNQWLPASVTWLLRGSAIISLIKVINLLNFLSICLYWRLWCLLMMDTQELGSGRYDTFLDSTVLSLYFDFARIGLNYFQVRPSDYFWEGNLLLVPINGFHFAQNLACVIYSPPPQ